MADHCVNGRLRLAFIAGFLQLFVAFAHAPAYAQTQGPVIAAAALVGVWRGTEIMPMGIANVEVIFFPNGTYSRAHVLGTLMTRDVGTYEVAQNWIHFRLENWWPRQYLGKPMHRPTSDTWVVTRFDGHALATAAISLTRAP